MIYYNTLDKLTKMHTKLLSFAERKNFQRAHHYEINRKFYDKVKMSLQR